MSLATNRVQATPMQGGSNGPSFIGASVGGQGDFGEGTTVGEQPQGIKNQFPELSEEAAKHVGMAAVKALLELGYASNKTGPQK